ncbi:MAG: hypothetical protein WCC64_11460 [Aliidongia sp.]
MNRLGLYAVYSIGVCVVSLGLPTPAHAYVGPGMDFGTLGAAFGMLMTGFSAVFYLSTLWLRRLWRRAMRMTLRSQRTAESDAMRYDS